MKINKKLGALLLACSMMFSMSAGVFADTIPDVAQTITKEYVMAEGIKTPASTFKFTATKVTADAPNATINDIVFSADDEGNLNNGKRTVSKKSDITFGAFPHAGEFVYTVKETKENAEGVEYSTENYTLRVYVHNETDGPKVKTVTAEKTTSDGTSSNKVNEIKFTNTYRKNASLTIENITDGALADRTKDFEFKITITPSETEKEPESKAKISYSGKIGDKEVTVTADEEYTFNLHDKQTLKFESLPAGTRYVVTAKGAKDDYTPSVKVIENGLATNNAENTDENELSSAKNGTNLVGESENKVTFTHTYKQVPMTGIIINNLPFVMVIAAAVIALGLFAILKKQRAARR